MTQAVLSRCLGPGSRLPPCSSCRRQHVSPCSGHGHLSSLRLLVGTSGLSTPTAQASQFHAPAEQACEPVRVTLRTSAEDSGAKDFLLCDCPHPQREACSPRYPLGAPAFPKDAADHGEEGTEPREETGLVTAVSSRGKPPCGRLCYLAHTFLFLCKPSSVRGPVSCN